MKKYLLLSLLVGAMTFSSCAQSKKTDSAPVKDVAQRVISQNKGKSINMTTDMFAKKVFNFRSNSKVWKYLGDKPCVIDFHATWCGPCKRLGPILEELAGEYGKQIYVYKVDIDAEPELAQFFGINSVPTVLLVPMKGEPQVVQGLVPKATMKQAIDEVLLNK